MKILKSSGVQMETNCFSALGHEMDLITSRGKYITCCKLFRKIPDLYGYFGWGYVIYFCTSAINLRLCSVVK